MKKRILSLTLLMSLLLASCGGTTIDDPVSQDSGSSETQPPADTTLPYPDELVNLGGRDFTILNCEYTWPGMFVELDFEAETGDVISDAKFKRARKTEEDLGIRLRIQESHIDQLASNLQTTVMAGDADFDAAYLPIMRGSCSLTNANVLNLLDVTSLNMDQPWWNQTFINALTYNGYLGACMDYNNIMSYTYSSGLFFNKDLLVNFNQDMPYDLVREGRWTHEAMRQYMAAVVNLNGDEAFASGYQAGNSVYGFGAQHQGFLSFFIQGSGVNIINVEDKLPVVNTNTARLTDVYDSVVSLFANDGFLFMENGSIASKNGAIYLFTVGRSLFYSGIIGLSAETDFRSLEMEYGILPYPMVDEAQGRYYTPISDKTMTVTIPKTASNPEESGAVIDYMSFLGYRDVIPTVQETLCYKGVRDDDSIEMLDIILESLYADPGYMTNISHSFTDECSSNIAAGDFNFASKYAGYKEIFEENVTGLIELIDELKAN